MHGASNVVIDRLGGTSAVAKLCRVKPPSVHGWRQHGIPDARLQFLRLAHPDAFEGIADSDFPAPTHQVAA